MYKICDFIGFSAEDAARIIKARGNEGKIQFFAERGEITKANSIISTMKRLYGEDNFTFSIIVS